MIIEYNKFCFTISAKSRIYLPYYKGSTFRGGFGNTFKRIVCALRDKDCRDCLLKSKCVYSYIFETSPDDDVDFLNMHKYEKIPHPFVIEPPESPENISEPGENLTFNLILIGKAIEYLPYFVYSFEELGKIGIGKGRGKYIIESIDSDKEQIYSQINRNLRIKPSNELTIDFEKALHADSRHTLGIEFITPLRIIHRRRLVSSLEFHILIRSLLRRISLLNYFHCGKKHFIYDHCELIRESEKVSKIDDSLEWCDFKRFSTKQNISMRLGGILGNIVFKGDNLGRFEDILKAGEIVHAGKGTSFGFGKYRLGLRPV